MKRVLALSMIAGLLFGLSTSMVMAQDTAKDGKTIFVDAKCINCHSVDSQAIEAKKKTDKTVDLSKAGESVTAEFMKSYLKKEEKLNDKKHAVAFKGEEADLDILVNWLAGLK